MGGAPEAVVRYFRDFSVLRETRREYWGLQVINILDSTAYFALLNIVVVSLSADYGFSDTKAGYVFTLFSSAVTIFLFFSGVFSDWLGIKGALVACMVGQVVARGAVVAAASMPEGPVRSALAIGGLALMAPFVAMVQTVFQAANKRFTTERSRGAGFNLWYLFMNVGAAAGGFVVDVFYLQLGLPRYHIFTLGIATSVLSLILVPLAIRRTDQLHGEGEARDEPAPPDRSRSPLQIARAVVVEPVFWRFTALISCLLGVRAVFLYLALLYPKFWLRVIGDDAQIGALQALNPVLVIVGLVVLIPVLNRFGVFRMLVTGAIITSLAQLLQAVPPFGGLDLARYTYLSTIVFLVVLTVGELIWSPRLQEYTAAVAPKGQEGTYYGLSMVPYFLAKTFVALLSGHMLLRWCPEDIGPRLQAGGVAYWDSPYAMWLILGLAALAGAVVALLFRRWFTKGAEAGLRETGPAGTEAAAQAAAGGGR
jgi:MFS family permease